MFRFVLGFAVAVLIASRVEAQPSAPVKMTPDVAFVIDTSGSMAINNRLEEARQSAKLACLILDCRVQFIGFSDSPDASDVFDLKTQRSAAIQWLDRLKAAGGTHYTSAIAAAVRLHPKCVVFVSDGEPSEEPTAVLDSIAKNVRCPLHTLAVETTPAARDLLSKMAAATSGGMHTIDKPAQLVDVFLGILGQLRQFARLDVTTDRHELRDVVGEVWGIGFDCVPDIGSKEPSASVTLSGAKVTLSRTTLVSRGNLVATTRQAPPKTRLILLRFDQAVAEMTLGAPEIRNGKGRVSAEVQFRDHGGQPLDPRKPDARLGVEFEVVTSDGKVVQTVPGKALTAKAVIGATLEVTVTDKQPVPYVIRAKNTDRTSGAPFVTTNTQAVVFDPAKAVNAPPLVAVTVMTGAGGRAGEPIRCTVTVQAQGGTPEERKQFLDSLKNQPPVVAAEWGRGQKASSTAAPNAFNLSPKIEGDSLVLSVAFTPTENASEYDLSVAESTAAGTRYPAARTRVRCVAAADLQLLIVAHRQVAGRRTLFDFAQKAGQLEPALDGDSVSLELVRGASIDPREFVSLGQGLRARFLGADGASTDVPLTLQHDRYTTAPMRARGPGRLKVEVAIAVEGLGLRLDGDLAVEKVHVRLAQNPLTRRLTQVPLGTHIRMNVGIHGQLASRTADRDAMLEILRRDGLNLRWTLTDGTGAALASDGRAAEIQPWSTQFRLARSGDARLTVELLDSQGTVLDSFPWALKVADSPLQVAVAMRSPDGTLKPLPAERKTYSYLPSWCVSRSDLVVTVKPTRSQFFAHYHLAQVQTASAAATFDEAAGEFRMPVSPGGEVEFIGTLRPYGWSAADPGEDAELQVSEVVAVPAHEELRVTRVVLTGVALLAVLLTAGLVARRVVAGRRESKYERVSMRVRVLGGLSGATPLVDRDTGGRFSTELVLCGKAGEPSSLRLVRPADANGQPRIALLKQNLDGSVSAIALADLPKLKTGQTRRLSYPEATEFILSPFVRLVVEPMPAARAK